MNATNKKLGAVLLALHCSFLACISAAVAFPLSEQGLVIADGESIRRPFSVENADRAVLVLLRSRIALSSGEREGAWALEVSFNGSPLNPGNVRVVNKEVVYDRPDVDTEHPSGASSVPLFDLQSGRWYLKADSDYVPFNDTDADGAYYAPDALTGESWWHNRHRARGAFESHYYEYLFEVPAEMVQAENVIELGAGLPQHYSDYSVEIAALHAFSADKRCILYARQWEDVVFEWQTPDTESLLKDGKQLSLHATRGEYRPATFSLYALEDIDELKLQITPLRHVEGDGHIAAENIRWYAFDEPEGAAPNPRRVGWIREIHFVPDAYKDHSPELLRYGKEAPFEAATHCTQRFFIDVKVPDDIDAGLYRGDITVLSAGEKLAQVAVDLDVYPFDLAAPGQTYWMWRLDWGPVWLQRNEDNLRKIRESGFSGQTLARGPDFDVSVDDAGDIQVDGSGYRRQVATLRNLGLDPTLRMHLPSGALATAVRAAGAPDLPSGARDFILSFVAHLNEDIRWDMLQNPNVPTMSEEDLPEKAFAELPEGKPAAEVLGEVESSLEHILKRMKDVSAEVGAKLYIFPVDEPDGTPWKRGWTRWLASRAHAAGLTVWATHNAVQDWDSGIDVSAPGRRLSRMYTEYGKYRPWSRVPESLSDHYYFHWMRDFPVGVTLNHNLTEKVPEERRKWYRENIKANYFQVRSMPPHDNRAKMGLMAWSFYNVEEITTFCYDWNFDFLYSVFPRGGQRDAEIWYPTLGWRATREGIDDARYLRTLELIFIDSGMSEPEARQAVRQVLEDIDDPASFANINRVPELHGSFDAMRRLIAERILKERNLD